MCCCSSSSKYSLRASFLLLERQSFILGILQDNKSWYASRAGWPAIGMLLLLLLPLLLYHVAFCCHCCTKPCSDGQTGACVRACVSVQPFHPSSLSSVCVYDVCVTLAFASYQHPCCFFTIVVCSVGSRYELLQRETAPVWEEKLT